LSETTTCAFIPNFTLNEQIMQTLWAKIHPSKSKLGQEIGQECFLQSPLCKIVKIFLFIYVEFFFKSMEKSNDWNFQMYDIQGHFY